MLDQIWVNFKKIRFFQEFIHSRHKKKSLVSQYGNLFHLMQTKKDLFVQGKSKTKLTQPC